MCPSTSASQNSPWLAKNGPRELELLLRSIVYYPSAPILITDDGGHSKDASVGAGKLLGLPREKLIGRHIDVFVPADLKPGVSHLWQALLEQSKHEGTFQLVGSDGTPREVEYTAKGNVLPVRHALVLQDKNAKVKTRDTSERIPSWAQDYALYLLDIDGRVAAWYAGAARIYGYKSEEALNQHVSFLYPVGEALLTKLNENLKRTAAQGHMADEGWQTRKDGSRFWANAVTLALKDEKDKLQGFGAVVRDFSDRHAGDEKLRHSREYTGPVPSGATITGVVSGEFERTPEANDAFLDLVGYGREDLASGEMHWPDLTPPQYAALDELAHEEGLRFGACTPYEKEMIRKDGTRVPVLVATAVLKLCPFRWITFVQDLRQRYKVESLAEEDNEPREHFEEMIGSSAALKRVLRQAEVVAPTDATVLILGETGTGKELVARAVHRMSPRKNLPFVTLNCAAIPTGLLESELFGYERGAFTGALSQKIGRFEMANHGTLFLDEVGDIPLDLQPKLLRALQEKSFERLGGTKTIPIDVRLVAATNRNLTQMMGDKLFRSDLYYRLKVFPITTPPLRDRPADIPELVRHFTTKYAAQMHRQIDKIPSETMSALANSPWPGNIRELENFIERAVILSRGPYLRAPLAEIRQENLESPSIATLELVEREHIVRVLK
jgi:PAS domain S-box-containing protein